MLDKLAPREREIVDILYKNGPSTVSEIRASLSADLTASAVRAMLVRLEDKICVRKVPSDRGYLYKPAVPQSSARKSAMVRLVKTFFRGSPAEAACALLDMSGKLSETELKNLEQQIANAKNSKSKR